MQNGARGAASPHAYAALAGSVVMFGATWPITKLALERGAAPLWFAEGRAAFAALSSLLALILVGRLRLPSRKDFPALLGVACFQLAGYFTLAHAGAALVPAGRTAILSNTTTIWVVPLSLILLSEKITPRQWLASALGTFGVAVMMNPWSLNWSAPGVLLGHGLLLAAGLSWSAAMILLRRYPPRRSMLELLPWCYGLATLLMAPLLLTQTPGRWGPQSLAALAVIGLVAAPVGSWCIMQATAGLPVAVSSIGFLITPAVGIGLSLIWLHEPPDAALLGGTVLILAGVMLAAWRR